MSRENIPLPNQTFFEAANTQQAEIQSTNERAELIPNLDDAEFEAIATESLTREQAIAFERLKEIAPAEPYEALTHSYQAAEESVQQATEEVATVRSAMSAELQHYDDLVQQLVAIAPLGEAQAKQAAERHKSEIALQQLEAARQRLAAAEQSRDELQALFEVAGQPWAVPYLVINSLKATIETPGFIDEIPVEPVMQDGVEGGCAGVERHIDAPEATHDVVQYLEAHAGQIVTVDDLIKELYPHVNDKSRLVMRARITRLLGPATRGEHIQDLLLEHDEGYELQYGWRRQYDSQADKAYGPRLRIYRVVSLQQTEAPAPVVLSSDYADSFVDNTPKSPEDPSKAAETSLVHDPATQITLDGLLNVMTQPDTMSPATGLSEWIAEHKAHSAAALEQREKRHMPEWLKAFHRDVDEAITELERMQLMGEASIELCIASVMHSSSTFGTMEALKRLEKTNLVSLNHITNRNQLNSFELTPFQRVAMHLFNKYQRQFAEKQKRHKMVPVINNALTSYYEKQRKTA